MALQVVFIFCLIVSAWAESEPESESESKSEPAELVVGGRTARIGEFPYQVSLQTGWPNSRHYCGGSLIHPKWVLTAGHCILGGSIIVKAGKLNIYVKERTEQTSTVLNALRHIGYAGEVGPYDIALFNLSRPFELNRFVNIIALPARNSEPVGRAILSGWGSTSKSFNPSYPIFLQAVILPLMDARTCQSIMYQSSPSSAIKVHKTNVCTYSHAGSCSGDSGGPLVSINSRGVKEIVGIVSWGIIPCGSRAPSVYVKVSSFIDWILDQTAAYYKI